MKDFSYPNMCYEVNSSKHGTCKKSLACVADHFLLQKVQEETRLLAILDLILTNRNDLVDEVSITELWGKVTMLY